MKFLFLTFAAFLLLNFSYGQSIECPPLGTSVIGQTSTVETLNPPKNPNPTRPTPEILDRRLVFFVHGLNGTKSAWEHAANSTAYQAPGQEVPGYSPRKVKSLLMTYNQFSLSGAAQQLHAALVAQGDGFCNEYRITDKSINFIIAHSQGGIVSRATDQMYEVLGEESSRRFGGIVTFGTPHQGAQIINNKDQIAPFMDEIISELKAGPELEALDDRPLLNFFVPNQVVTSVADKLKEVVGNYIVPKIIDHAFPTITEDYKVGAVPLAELNGYNSTIPKVAFFGVESDPVFYKAAYSFYVKQPNEFPPFQADNDMELVNKFGNMLGTYTGKYETYNAFLEELESWGLPFSFGQCVFMPAFCAIWNPVYYNVRARRDGYKRGVIFLENSNDKYKAIIGAIETSTYTTTGSTGCVTPFGSTFPPQGGSCPPGTTMVNTPPQTYTLTVHKENDGTVIAESAMGFPGAKNAPMIGSNHMQMRNDSNTKARLNELFDGQHGPYFFTEKQ